MGMDYNQFMRNFRFCAWVLVLVLGSTRLLMADSALSGHAMTMFDNETPKYAAAFPHFDYVNPTAPKGGALRLAVDGTFDSFNLVYSQRQCREHRLGGNAPGQQC